MESSRLVNQLGRLRDAHPRRPLVVFVPRAQLGHALDTALARARAGWQGVRTCIPRHYAEALAVPDVLQSGRREAAVEEGLFQAARILQALPDDGADDDLPGWHLLASTVDGALGRLREGDVSVADVRERARAEGASETLGVVARCYDRYHRLLDDDGLYDDAHVFRWATERVRQSPPVDVPESVYAVVGATELSERAARFLDALRTRAAAFVRLGTTGATPPPAEAAAARFADVPRPGEEASEEGPSTTPEGPDRFVRAVGATTEVKAVFRDLLRDDVPFDDATIAFAHSRPYASLLADEAERVGVPTTMGPGHPADHTRTGRALRDLLDWVREDFDPELLIRMLRGGLLRTDRWLRHRDEEEGESPPLPPHEAATLLAGRSYEPGREGLIGGLKAAARAADDEDRPEWETPRPERLWLLAAYVEALTALIPREARVETLADHLCTFLEVFGPDDPPAAEEGARTLDEAGRALLYDRLQRLTDATVSLAASAPRLAALFRRWLDGQYVQAETPRPGHVHILPLESVGYDDRSHLYVVGLDSTTFAAPLPENGLLQEADRRALVASAAEETAPTTPADEALWRADRALRRHRGPAAYYTRIFDVEAGEERDPSALFLQRERAAEETTGARSRTVGLVPSADAVTLSDGECWLAAYRARTENGDGAASSARTRLHDEYPWIADGEAARRARRSDRYTVYDGLLPNRTSPDLTIFDDDDRPLSASRLETLAEAPYVYFLKYVLDVRPLEEPAIDDEPWLNHRRKGTLLHRIYERFMRGLGGRPPTPDDAERMGAVVDAVLEEEIEQEAPPSEVVKAAARRELRRHARLFLRAEIERGPDYRPEHFELGFGFPPHRRQDDDYPHGARLSVGDRTLLLRGRIDRVDRSRTTDRLVAWDYKTGSTAAYDESDPLQDGKTLQWALYAYALEALTGDAVEASGYFFASETEVGTRIAADPAAYRAEVEQILERLGALAESGSFPMTPDLHKVSAWTWGGYDRLVPDLRRRRAELRGKAYPEDRPEPPSF